jgi:hypothetical protein
VRAQALHLRSHALRMLPPQLPQQAPQQLDLYVQRHGVCEGRAAV